MHKRLRRTHPEHADSSPRMHGHRAVLMPVLVVTVLVVVVVLHLTGVVGPGSHR